MSHIDYFLQSARAKSPCLNASIHQLPRRGIFSETYLQISEMLCTSVE